MDDLQLVTWERGLLIAGTLALLAGASVYYNHHIDREIDLDPTWPNSALYVAIGVGYTLLGAFALLCILYGLERAMWTTCIIGGSFVASGVPMMIGAGHRNVVRRYRENEEAKRLAREAELEKELR